MKICYLCADPGIPVFGRKGSSTHVREACLALLEAGHDVRLICANAGGDSRGRDRIETLEVARPTSKKLGFDLRHALVDRNVSRALGDTVRSWRPDAIYERYSLYGRAGGRAARRFGLPHILELNALLSVELADRIRMPPLASAVERRIIRRARHVIVVSEPLRSEAAKLRNSDDEITMTPTAVNTERFNPEIDATGLKQELGLEGKFVIGYVGALTGWHGIKLLYGLVEELTKRGATDFVVFVVGGNPERLAKHRARTDERGLSDRLIFHGSVPHDEIPRAVRVMDVGLVPDTTPWSAPVKLFEYLASGVPAIAARYPAVEAAMDDGQEGLLFQPKSVAAMADAIEKAMGDPELLKTLGGNARERTVKDYSWGGAVTQIEAILKSQHLPGR